MDNSINLKIAEYLQLRGKKQNDIAKLLGLTKTTVSKKMNGKISEFNEKQLEQIGKLLNAPFAEMARNAVKMGAAYPTLSDEAENTSEEQASYGHQSRSVMALELNISQLQATKQIMMQEIDDLRRSLQDKDLIIQSLQRD